MLPRSSSKSLDSWYIPSSEGGTGSSGLTSSRQRTCSRRGTERRHLDGPGAVTCPRLPAKHSSRARRRGGTRLSSPSAPERPEGACATPCEPEKRALPVLRRSVLELSPQQPAEVGLGGVRRCARQVEEVVPEPSGDGPVSTELRGTPSTSVWRPEATITSLSYSPKSRVPSHLVPALADEVRNAFVQ